MEYFALKLFFHEEINTRTGKKLKNSVQEEQLGPVR